MAYLITHNQNPQVFVWSASVERISAKIAKCKEVLDSLHYQVLPKRDTGGYSFHL